MCGFLKRAIGKFTRECSRISIMTKMIRHRVNLPNASDAMASLLKFSPDLGNSCWTDAGFQFEERRCVLSVIVPAYNVEKYIDRCMDSILQQRVSFSYEVIVVNDGSTDGTALRLAKYEYDERVRIIHQENRGLSAARNRGIDSSRGEYLCFVDSDDTLSDGSLEALVSTALQRDAKLVVGSYEKCAGSGKVQYTKRLENKKVDGTTLPGFAHGRVIHYSVFRNLRFPEGYWYEDSVMAQIVHPMCHDAAYTISHVCLQYYTNESGITATSEGNPKALDSLWITIRLLRERELFGLVHTQDSYGYFLSMVNLTYQRTKYLGADVVKCVFVMQRTLMDQYYSQDSVITNRKKQLIRDALRQNNFKKYILACERKS